MFGILIEWDFGIRFEGEKDDRYHLTTTSRPRKNIRYTTYDYEASSDIVPYTKMAESAFEEFGRALAAGFGVTVPEPTDEDWGSSYGSGGYGGGGYGGGSTYGKKYGKGKYSPEMQKTLDDLIKKGVIKPDQLKLFDN
jgi:hypothetical protein